MPQSGSSRRNIGNGPKDAFQPRSSSWLHAPPHRLEPRGTYMVTSGTYLKTRIFSDGPRLKFLHDTLLETAITQGWQLEAWAVFPNHYHFIARRLPSHFDSTTTLRELISDLHQETSDWVNLLDQAPGRKVWHNFWDSTLTYERSWLARLNYVHHNPVKHGIVKLARDYPWCSAAWFERVATASWIKTVYAFKTDRLKIEDEY